MGTSPFPLCGARPSGALLRILRAVPREQIPGTAGADRRYHNQLTRVTRWGYYSAAGRARPAIEPYASTVESWLSADESAPRKQRHTARRVYDRLVEEQGYRGSLSTVERFVREWREARRGPGPGFLELEWPAGTAQVDYGECFADVGGSRERLHALVVSFPHSNARFEVLTRAQRSENACWALAEIFHAVGRAPAALVLDNATECGRRAGEVVRESALFSALRAHYGYSATYCNPYAGHEKGSVENAVGFLRRNLMVPVPSAPTLEKLNARLLEGCARLLGAERRPGGPTVRELFREDLAACPPLPAERFDAVRRERRRADKEGRVRVDGSLCLAGPHWHGRDMVVGVRNSTVELLDARGGRDALLPRSYAPGGETVRDPASLIPALTARPRSWPESPLRAEVPPALRDALDSAGLPERRTALRALARAAAGARICASGRLPDDASCDLLAGRIASGEPDLSARADMSVYDGLIRGVSWVATTAEIVEAGSRCSLTRAVLRERAEAGTPRQMEYLLGYLEAEVASREASRRARLLRAAALPVAKTFDGYDWAPVSFPEGFGRADLESLSFLGRREDLVLMGDVGTGKTHMASALVHLACSAGVEARFFTASSLVARLRRAKADGRLDRELAQVARARMVVVDELGYLPLDAEGARLLFQVISDSYERRSLVITTNLEFSRWATVFGDDQMAAAVDRVCHHGRLLQFRGESYRVRHALMRAGSETVTERIGSM